MNYGFKDKKITMMGLGILGRGVNVAKFLAENGAILTITDLKNAEQLESSLIKLKKFENITYVLGEHRLEDFRDKDIVIKSAGVPLDSVYIAEARKNNISVEMDASLFVRLAKESGKNITIIGITGTRGKSTTTHLLFEILKNGFDIQKKSVVVSRFKKKGLGGIFESSRQVFLGGNVKGLATLPLLKKIKDGDIVVMELDSWQLQGFGDAKISPDIAVFTTFMPDHLNYYKGDMKMYFNDKANIYRNQKEGDVLFMRPEVAEFIQDKDADNIKSEIVVVDKKDVPEDWDVKLLGDNNRETVVLASAIAERLGVEQSVIKEAVENFGCLAGRLEFLREVNGVKYYNDTTATTPDGVINALDSLSDYRGKIVLIGGGADKKLDYTEYAEKVKENAKALILFMGEASEKILSVLNNKITRSSDGRVKESSIISGITSMKDSFAKAQEFAEEGDIVLLSPGAASFGVFKNEFDRGDQFCELVKNL